MNAAPPPLSPTTAPTVLVTTDDLDWWLALAPTLRWHRARTYDDTAPHSYVVRDKTISGPDLERAVRVIRTFGAPGMYWSHPQVYLAAPPGHPSGSVKWWAGNGEGVEARVVVNQADASLSYGDAPAPRTHPNGAVPGDPASWAPYDALATGYDRRYDAEHCPQCAAENTAVARLVARRFGAYAPRVLDVGCGTGLALDLGLTSPHLYTGVDASAGMLNELVRKHPGVPPGALVPGRIEDRLAAGAFRPREFEAVLALFGVASYLAPDAVRALPALSSDLTLLMGYTEGYLPDYWAALSPSGRPDPDHVEASRAAVDDLYAAASADHNRARPPSRFRLGSFEVTVL